jgi:hypothetical protein
MRYKYCKISILRETLMPCLSENIESGDLDIFVLQSMIEMSAYESVRPDSWTRAVPATKMAPAHVRV